MWGRQMKRERLYQILFNLSSWKELVWSVGSRGAKTRCWAWWSAPTEREPGRGWLRKWSVNNGDAVSLFVCLSVTKNNHFLELHPGEIWDVLRHVSITSQQGNNVMDGPHIFFSVICNQKVEEKKSDKISNGIKSYLADKFFLKYVLPLK